LKYTELVHRTSGLQKDIADAGQLDFLDDVDNIALKLRTFSDRIKNASYGYSGFFDTVKINEKELTQIYTFDTAFFTLGDQISSDWTTLKPESAVMVSRLPSTLSTIWPGRSVRPTTAGTRSSLAAAPSSNIASFLK